MKAVTVLTTLLIVSVNAYALDGKQFVDCFESDVNTTIRDYKTVIEKKVISTKLPSHLNEGIEREIQITKGDTTRICSELSSSAKVDIKEDFFEDYNGNLIPYEAEDILLATVGDLIGTLKNKVDCYNPYKDIRKSKDVKMKAPTLLGKIIDDRNTKLVKDALGLMLSQNLKDDDMEKSLLDFSLTFCKKD